MKYAIRRFLGSHACTIHATRLKPSLKSRFATKDTELVIDGYPRSGNSYAMYAFKLVNPNTRIATHMHMAGQIERAVKLGVPCLVLMREPMEAIASYLVYCRGAMPVRDAIRDYIAYYKKIRKLSNKVVIADTELVFRDFPAVIRHLNEQFNTSFTLFEQHKDNINTVNNLLYEASIKSHGDGREFMDQSVCPNPYRRELKQKMREELHKEKNAGLMLRAYRLYEGWR